jgi:hypothetical protein
MAGSTHEGGVANSVWITGSAVPLFESAVTIQDAAGDPLFTQSNPGLVTLAPVANFDAFGRLRVAQPTLIFASNQGYDAEPLVWQTVLSGAGATATWSATTRSTPLTLANVTGYVVRQSYQYLPYQPGRSQFITMTGVLGAAVPNVTKRIGQFDAKNGLFFEQTAAGVLQVVERSNGIDTAVAQANWNLDPLDGTGASGIVLDETKDQIFVLDYGWLGTATVRYGVYLNGIVVYCHASHHANLLSTSYMQTANLPLRYEISSTADASATLVHICSAVVSEGGYYESPSYIFAADREISAALSTASEVPLVAIRPALTLNSIVNRIRLRSVNASVLAIGSSVRYRLLYYPPGTSNPVTGGAWAVPNAASGVEANASGTALSLTGAYEMQGDFVGAGVGVASRGSSAVIVTQTMPLTLDMAGAGDPRTTNVGNNPAYLVLAALGASATAAGRMEWEEVR